MKIANIMLAQEFGGIGQVATDYNAIFLAQGHGVLVLYDAAGIWGEAFIKQQQDFPMLILAPIRGRGGIRALSRGYRIRRQLIRFKPDVIIVHNYHRQMAVIARGIAPVVAVTHMYKFKYLPGYHGVIALTPELYQHCLTQGVHPNRLFLIPNTLTPGLPPATHTSMRSTPIVIGAMGRFSPEKGLDDFITALSHLKEKNIIYHAVIAGAGPEESALKALAARLGVTSHITFLGYVADTSTFYAQIDIFCVPSIREPFGLVVLEAWHYRVPVVSTTVGGLGFLVKDKETGLSVAPFRPDQLAEAFMTLIHDPLLSESLVNNASVMLHNHYTAEAVYPKLEKMLATVLKKEPEVA